ncbi:MAG: hypothetical protein WAN87_00835 [Thermoplasmata archaeon]
MLLAIGAIAPLILFGLLVQIFIPIVLFADFLAVFFFLSLWRRYRSEAPTSGALPPVPPSRRA